MLSVPARASQTPIPPPNSPSMDLDLQRLASLIRERESSLVMLLEEKKQKLWERPEWLLKECEYQEKDNRLSREIRGIILRWVLLGNEEIPREDAVRAVRGFWVKVKMVMKTSLERIKLLNLLNYQLFERYESIIEAMNVGYDRAAGITHYRDIEEMIKNRNKTIHEILSNSGKVPLLQRERSEQSAKMFSVKECPSETKIKKSLVFSKKNKETIEPKMIRRPLSHQSNKHRFPSKDFLMSRKVRKMENFIEDYESKLFDVMEGKLEVNIDKKKNVQQNLEMLFDQIMERNMNNHRTISKYTFSHSGKVFKRLSKRTLKPIPKKIVENQTPKPRKEGRKKEKMTLSYGRAKSAKLKRNQINKVRHSQVFEGDLKPFKTKKFL